MSLLFIYFLPSRRHPSSHPALPGSPCRRSIWLRGLLSQSSARATPAALHPPPVPSQHRCVSHRPSSASSGERLLTEENTTWPLSRQQRPIDGQQTGQLACSVQFQQPGTLFVPEVGKVGLGTIPPPVDVAAADQHCSAKVRPQKTRNVGRR